MLDAAQHVGGGDEILARLRLVELAEQRARVVFVARITAQREQRVRRKRDEVFQRQTTRDVFDMRIQAAVLVNDQHHRQRLADLGRFHKIAARGAVTLRRGEFDVLRDQPRIVTGDFLRRGELRAERGEQPRRGAGADREARRADEEAATVDRAVDVLVEQLQHFWIEIPGASIGNLRHR